MSEAGKISEALKHAREFIGSANLTIIELRAQVEQLKADKAISNEQALAWIQQNDLNFGSGSIWIFKLTHYLNFKHAESCDIHTIDLSAHCDCGTWAKLQKSLVAMKGSQ